MKGLVVSGTYTTDADSGHKAGIYLIVIPERDNLLVASTNGETIVASRGTDISRNTVVGEIEVPDELVEKVQRFLDAKAALNATEPAFRELLPATRAVKFKEGDRVRIVRMEKMHRAHGDLEVGMEVVLTYVPPETKSERERWTPDDVNHYGVTMPPKLVEFAGGSKRMVTHGARVWEDEIELVEPAAQP